MILGKIPGFVRTLSMKSSFKKCWLITWRMRFQVSSFWISRPTLEHPRVTTIWETLLQLRSRFRLEMKSKLSIGWWNFWSQIQPQVSMARFTITLNFFKSKLYLWLFEGYCSISANIHYQKLLYIFKTSLSIILYLSIWIDSKSIVWDSTCSIHW